MLGTGEISCALWRVIRFTIYIISGEGPLSGL